MKNETYGALGRYRPRCRLMGAPRATARPQPPRGAVIRCGAGVGLLDPYRSSGCAPVRSTLWPRRRALHRCLRGRLGQRHGHLFAQDAKGTQIAAAYRRLADDQVSDIVTQLLIVYHSLTGGTAQMVQAAATGARSEAAVGLRVLRAAEATVGDVLAAEGYIFATPENLAGMSGQLKDFFDRTYYAALD